MGGRDRRFVSAEVHPWRLDPDHWRAVLDSVCHLGFGAVAAYVPWAVHEVRLGEFDFTGERDVARFCALAGERDLMVVLRVGPDCGAELAGSGWPRRILDDPRCQARRPDGRPYLLVSSTHHCFPPSYASSVVLEEVGRWYDAVAAVVAPLQAPDGPVVAVQVDNELGYHFQANSYALDHHPDALAQYRAFVVERWGGLGAANDAYGTAHASVDDLVAPSDVTDGPEVRRLDWVAWKEHHLRASLAAMAAMLRARGVDRMPLVHNHHPRVEPPIDLGAMEASGAIDLCGADLYITRHGGAAVCDLVRHLAGSSRLPWMAELGAGWLSLPWLLPMGTEPADATVSATRALLGGARGANVYMAVERDRWSGSPIGADGAIRPDRAALWPKLLGLLDDLGWDDLRRWAPVLLLANRAEQRRAAACDTLANAVPCFSQILPIDHRLTRLPNDAVASGERWHADLAEVLSGASVDFDRAATSAMPALDRYELVVLPSVELVDADAWSALTATATPEVCGPARPVADERLRPLDTAGGRARVLYSPDDLRRLLPSPPARCAHPDVDVAFWSGPQREVLVAWNRSGDDVDAQVEIARGAQLHGRWRDEKLDAAPRASFVLAPYDLQVWELAR